MEALPSLRRSPQLDSTLSRAEPLPLRVTLLCYPKENDARYHGTNVKGSRGFGMPENGSKKEGLALTTSPEIHKAPYRKERNLPREFSRI